MTVRFASFNVENLFARPRAFNLLTWEEGRPILASFAEFNELIALADYTVAVKARMIDLLVRLEVYRVDDGVIRRNRVTTPRWAWLRANRGTFDVEHEATGIEIVADNRSDWTGWVELATEPVSDLTVEMTARVIQDLHADVLGVVEAENRPSLDRFNQERLPSPYEHVMLIDGNDTRGIDVGIVTTGQVEIASMKSHVDVPDPVSVGEHLFSRDCAQYECRLPSGATVWVLLNHFKSQSGGGGDKRNRQAQGVRDIVDGLVAAGETIVVVMGDLNEGPAAEGQSAPNLGPLYGPNGPLVDAYSLQAFDPGQDPAASRAVGSATAWTTSSSRESSPGGSSEEVSNAAGCGERRRTRTRRRTGSSTTTSMDRSMLRPTTPPSSSMLICRGSSSFGAVSAQRLLERQQLHRMSDLFRSSGQPKRWTGCEARSSF